MENNQRHSQTSYSLAQSSYNRISIRPDLPEINKSYPNEERQYHTPDDFWLKTFHYLVKDQCNSTSNTSYTISFSRVNGPYTFLDDQHPILTAFLRAYNSHEDVILSADDIWLMICIYFANYINSNGHGLTHLYVDHQTNNVLTVENEQADWFYFLHQIRCQMNDRIKPDAYHLLSNNFSTTNEIESLISSVAMMSIFKKVSPVNRSIHSCGIRNVHFTGQLNDWLLLRDKTSRLQQWTNENDDFYLYIEGLAPILNEFIETYKGNVNQLFWDRIFDLDHHNDQSSQSDGTTINGWFRQLCYGNHLKPTCSLAEIQLNVMIVPVKVDDESNNASKTSTLLGGFHGVDSFETKHKPVLSLVIIEDFEV